MVIKKMSEIMDTTNKSEDTRDAADTIEPVVSDQEKTVEVSIFCKEPFSLPRPLQEEINFFNNLIINMYNKQA